jgi:type III secretion protein T
VREFVIGLVCGVFFLPLFVVPRAAGTLIDQQAGTSMILLNDQSMPEGASTLFADLFEQCALYAFVVAGGFAMLSEMYAVSWAVWPATASGFLPLEHFFTAILPTGFTAVVVQAVLHAAPYVTVLLLFEYGIGLVGRSAPQINVLTTAAAVKLWLSVALIYLGGLDAFRLVPLAAERTLHDGVVFLYSASGLAKGNW